VNDDESGRRVHRPAIISLATACGSRWSPKARVGGPTRNAAPTRCEPIPGFIAAPQCRPTKSRVSPIEHRSGESPRGLPSLRQRIAGWPPSRNLGPEVRQALRSSRSQLMADSGCSDSQAAAFHRRSRFRRWQFRAAASDPTGLRFDQAGIVPQIMMWRSAGSRRAMRRQVLRRGQVQFARALHLLGIEFAGGGTIRPSPSAFGRTYQNQIGYEPAVHDPRAISRASMLPRGSARVRSPPHRRRWTAPFRAQQGSLRVPTSDHLQFRSKTRTGS